MIYVFTSTGDKLFFPTATRFRVNKVSGLVLLRDGQALAVFHHTKWSHAITSENLPLDLIEDDGDPDNEDVNRLKDGFKNLPRMVE